MKKNVQNVLAENSDGTIAYICGKCHSEVAKDAKVCNNCGAKLGNIRCPFCNFKGDVDDFKNDTCPRCGRKNKLDIKLPSDRSKVKDRNNIGGSFSRNYFLPLFIILTIALLSIVIIFVYYFELF